jgi:two-component system response regulator HydG
MFNILIVDDDEALRQSLAIVLKGQGYYVDQAGSHHELVKCLEEHSYDLIMLDLRLGGDSGIDMLKDIKGTDPGTEVMMITGFATIDTAVEAMKLGACDYITKPFRRDELLLRVKGVLKARSLEKEVELLRTEFQKESGMENIVGTSKPLLRVLEVVKRVASTDSTVLITGETGTGKDLIARAIHTLSRRSQKPFVSVNCAAFPENLLESELFGYVKGAFTGAVTNRRGLIQEADSGTFFLDEVGAMPPTIQAKLLRVLEDRTIRRLGENQSIKVDIRIVAATNEDLVTAVQSGNFREDLFYRLNVVSIHLPPLRARRGDIPVLAEYFLKQFSTRESRRIAGFSETALALLMNYEYPGNVRELAHIVEHAVALSTGDVITATELPASLREQPKRPETQSVQPRPIPAVQQPLDERHLIIQAIEKHPTISEAAEALGMSRATLWRKMKKYSLTKRIAVETP